MNQLAIDYSYFHDLQECDDSELLSSSKRSLTKNQRSKLSAKEVADYTRTTDSGQNQNDSEDEDINLFPGLSTNDVKDIVKPILFLEQRPLKERFVSLQKYEGVVESVEGDEFSAKLVNLTDVGLDDVATFDIEEVTDEDRLLIKVGAVFYWSIGYHKSSSGQRTRSSHIRFRRLPVWSKTELAEAKRISSELQQNLGW